MKLEKYSALRPCLWHLTTRDNWISIRKRSGESGDYSLESTASLHGHAKAPAFELAEPRGESQSLKLPWGSVLICDQAPLVKAERRFTFPEDWDFARYCGWLNGFVFFWPGTQDAPSTRYGKKHFKHYLTHADVKLTFLKIDAERILRRYAKEVLFASENSGAPVGGKKAVERGPGIFVTAGEIGVPSNVEEVVFRDGIVLKRDEVTPVSESRMREHFGLEDA